MIEWSVSTLGDLCHKITDGAHHSPKEDPNGLPMFSVKDMKEQGFDYSKPKKISGVDFDKLIASGCQPSIGDILIAKDGSVMKHVFAVNNQADYVLLSSIAIVKPDSKKIDSRFLVYALKSPDVTDTILNNFVSGSGVPRIVLKDFKKVEILLPPIEEQKSITSVLGSLDNKINLLHRQNTTLESLAETLFRQWFVEEAQEDFEERPLSSIANFLNGLACQKFPVTDPTNKLPVLKIKELSSGVSENSDWASSLVKSQYIIQSGDVIFAWSASLMVKVWDGEKSVLNQHLFKVTSHEFPKWFYLAWCKYHLAEFISISSSHATTMGHIKRSDLDKAIVKIPKPETLASMTCLMSPLLEKSIFNAQAIKTLEKLRDNLLPKLVSGELRTQND